jgi:hypothetical protein
LNSLAYCIFCSFTLFKITQACLEKQHNKNLEKCLAYPTIRRNSSFLRSISPLECTRKRTWILFCHSSNCTALYGRKQCTNLARFSNSLISTTECFWNKFCVSSSASQDPKSETKNRGIVLAKTQKYTACHSPIFEKFAVWRGDVGGLEEEKLAAILVLFDLSCTSQRYELRERDVMLFIMTRTRARNLFRTIQNRLIQNTYIYNTSRTYQYFLWFKFAIF